MFTGLAQTLERSSIAAWVSSSPLILGGLSGTHLIGFTVVVGAALVSGLHMIGAAFADRRSREILGTTSRVLACGLAASVITGMLLVSPRAQSAVDNWIFSTKMLLLTAATCAQLAVGRFARRADDGSLLPMRAWGVLTVALWLAVGVSGAAFILLE